MLNLKLAFRTLFKAPFVTLVAILSLALGIGANAAIFSMFDQMLLRTLPVREPAELVNLGAPGPKPGSQTCSQAGDCDTVFSYPMLRDLERVQKVFTGIGAHRVFGANLAFEGQTLSGRGVLVSGGYFPTLGVQSALGRLLGPVDDRKAGESLVAVLSHAYWVTRFGGRSDVLNKTIIVNGHPLTVVGVAPRGFDGTTLGVKPEVFVPITLRELMWSGGPTKIFENRRAYWIYLFARLRPGVSIDQARAELNGQYSAILNTVEAPLQEGMSAQTLKRFRAKQVVLEEGPRGQSSARDEVRGPMRLLLGVTTFVLYGFITTWWGGWVFGPRYMTDLLPFMALWLVRTPLPRRARPAVALAFVAALAWSLWVPELGVRSYPCGWDAHPANIDRAPERLWRLHDTEIARCWSTLR